MSAEGLQYFSAFGIDESVLKKTLEKALSRGAQWAELFFEHSQSQHIALEDAVVNQASSSISLGVGIRVVHDEQTGYAFTEALDLQSMLEAASSAAMIAKGNNRFEDIRFELKKHHNRYPIQKEWTDVGIQDKVPILQKLNQNLFAADPRVIKGQVSMAHSKQSILIVESNGNMHFDVQPMTRLSMSCTAEQGKQRESNGASLAGREGFEFINEARLSKVCDETIARTMFLFDATPAPAGEMPIVLCAASSGILLHEAIGHGMEADFNRKNISIYSDQLNQRIAPKGITIIDDGTKLGDRGAINIDDEGTEGKKTVLVDDGILASYMHDKISAKFYGVAPTGNGRRESFRSPPLPRMRNTYMLPGQYDPQELIQSVDHGVYAQSFTNGQVMIGAGDFTFYIKTGYLIENGKLTRPIKDTNIIGNGPEILQRTDMVGNDFAFDDGGWTCGKDGQSVPVSLGMPSVRISKITIGGVN
jgi:TldD protein